MANGDIGTLRTKLSFEDEGASKSMEGFKRDLKGLSSEMKVARSFGKKYSQSLKGMKEQSGILTKKFKTQKAQVKELGDRYKKLTKNEKHNKAQAEKLKKEYNDVTAQMNKTKGQLGRVNKAIKDQENPWKKLGRTMEDTGQKMQNVGRGMKDAGRTMTTGLTLPLVGLAGVAVKTGIDFEAGMSKVEAVSGATGDEMKKLESKAREMGESTVFSATEVSDSFYYMSLAGWDAEQSMGAVEGVMDLAAASGEDLASVADIVTDGISAFGLEAEQSGKMADVLAAASSNANTDVAGLGQAFSYVAPVAGALSFTMEDTSKAIGLMASSGIKSSKAGTALRTMMTNLAKPTKEMKVAMDKYGISLTDSEGEMNSFEDVMQDLRKGVGDLDEDQQAQAASTLFGKEAMSGALAIINTTEEDYDKLSGAIKNSEGAASDMADTMTDNAQGSMKKFKSAAEEASIALSAHVIPALTEGVDYVTDLTKKFGDLDESTQKNILKFGGLVAAIGPALVVLGSLTTGIGGVVRVVGTVSTAIGSVGGAGMLGSLGALGPLAVGGIAVAGIAGVAYGLKKLYDRSKETEEVNLDLAQSFSDQAKELEGTADRYDELTEKSKASNQQLSRLNDLNIAISESNNKDEIEELKDEYNKLAKETGLTKDELIELLEANATLVEDSPKVETAISAQGNAFTENTDAVRDQIEAMRDLSELELDTERTKLLAEEEETRRKLAKYTREERDIKEEISGINELAILSESERMDKIRKIREQLDAQTLSEKDRLRLQEEMDLLLDIEQGKHVEIVEELQGQLKTTQESVEKEQEKLDKLDATEQSLVNIKLQNVGINEEGAEGLAILDKTLTESQKEIDKLYIKKKTSEGLTEAEEATLEELKKQVTEHKNAQREIEEVGKKHGDVNLLVDNNLKKLDDRTRKEIDSIAKNSEIEIEQGNIVDQVRKQNKQHDKVIGHLENEKDENGNITKENQKIIDKLETKKGENVKIIKQILEEQGLWSEVKDTILDGADGIDTQRENTRKLSGVAKDVYDRLLGNNKETKIGIGLQEDLTTEAGKDVDKKVDLTMNPINKKFSIPFFGTGYAQGTGKSGHPGGLAQVNDGVGSNAGPELIRTPDGQTGMFKGKNVVANLPKGTHVLSARDTKKSIPRYAKGTTGLDSSQDFGFKGIKKGLGSYLGGILNNTFTSFGSSAFDFIKGNLTNNLSKVFSGGYGQKGKPAFNWPVTSQYGWRTHPISGNRRLHAGTDYGAPSGSPIPSTSQGVVSHAGWSGGYGNQVKVKNGPWEMSYAHMSRTGVSRGQSVRKGTVLGSVGSTGNSTGPHLHYETRKNGVPVNPLAYAKGTDNHPGGSFLAGEEGYELGRMGNHWEVLNKGVYDRPKGYEVFPHDESKKMARAISGMPSYASGTNGRGVYAKDEHTEKLLNATLEQNEILHQLVSSSRNIEGKPVLTDEDVTEAVNGRNAYDNLGRVF